MSLQSTCLDVGTHLYSVPLRLTKIIDYPRRARHSRASCNHSNSLQARRRESGALPYPWRQQPALPLACELEQANAAYLPAFLVTVYNTPTPALQLIAQAPLASCHV